MERGLFDKVECVRFDNCFMESSSHWLLGQPVNTITNVGFIVVGLIILFSTHSSLPKLQRYLLSATGIVIGLSSAYYHMTMTFLGQILDLTGMYMLAAFVLFYAVMRLRHWDNKRFLLAYFALLAPLLTVLVFLPEIRNFVFAAVLLAGLVFEFIAGNKDKLDWHLLLASLLVLLVAFAVWLCDINRIIDFNGHAIWHIFNAVALYLLFRYYSTKRKLKNA